MNSHNIGGYLELESSNRGELYRDLIKLNSGRSCLELLAAQHQIPAVALPFYHCEAMREPLERLGIPYTFYAIDKHFEIDPSFEVPSDAHLIYINYFGLKSEYIRNTLVSATPRLIVDNSQAFFCPPLGGSVPTFYSCRKFFGVPDGGYLADSTIEVPIELEQDVSWDRMGHLLKRVDDGPRAGYADYQRNEKHFSTAGVKRMSRLTERLMKSIDYSLASKNRIVNFQFLHMHLNEVNELPIRMDGYEAPLAYPLLVKSDGLRRFLIQNNVFVPTFWETVTNLVTATSIEYEFASRLVPLPIDQRLELTDLEYVVNLVTSFLDGRQ